jgi:hypothetical protein
MAQTAGRGKGQAKMAYVYHDIPGIHRCALIEFVRTEYGDNVWYQMEVDGEHVASIFCEELPPITVVRSSPIEGAK